MLWITDQYRRRLSEQRYLLYVELDIKVVVDELLDAVLAPVTFGTSLSVSVSSTRVVDDVVVADVTLCVTGGTDRLVALLTAGVAVALGVVDAGVEVVCGIPGVVVAAAAETAPSNPEESAT